MEYWVGTLLTIVTTLMASGGFWTYMQKKDTTKQATTQLLRGLAHEKIIELGSYYMERGWVTKDEYEDFHHYLYKPYDEVGGNGMAEKIMREVDKLPIRPSYHQEPEITMKGRK